MGKISSKDVKSTYIFPIHEDVLEFSNQARQILKSGWCWTNMTFLGDCIKKDKYITNTALWKQTNIMHYGAIIDNIHDTRIEDKDTLDKMDILIDDFRRNTNIFENKYFNHIINCYDIRNNTTEPVVHLRAGVVDVDNLTNALFDSEEIDCSAVYCISDIEKMEFSPKLFSHTHNTFDICTDGKYKLSKLDKRSKFPNVRFMQVTDFNSVIFNCNFYNKNTDKLIKTESTLFI